MFRLWFSFALAGLLVAFSLPFVAIRRLVAGPGLRVAWFPAIFLRRSQTARFEHQRLWASDEFGFEHAVQAYEKLIDAHVSTQGTKTSSWGHRFSTPRTKTCFWGPRWRPR